MDEVSFYKPDVVVDALLGIGAKLPLRGEIKEAAKLINSYNAYKVSIDVPTGMDADTGETDLDFVKPDATIALHAVKTGMEKAGKEKTGEIWVLDIGL
jgi:NAD(P)H-hydrate epimerase